MRVAAAAADVWVATGELGAGLRGARVTVGDGGVIARIVAATIVEIAAGDVEIDCSP